ncbi:MAG: tetratricopeptide repeat protein [Isosphaeraceae bacterium]
MVNNFRASLLTLLLLSVTTSASGQAPGSPKGQPTAPGLIKLTGEDDKRAKQLDDQIDKALKADRWDEAIGKAEELLALRTRVQGPKHFETVNTEWRLKALRSVALMPNNDRIAYLSAIAINEQAETLYAQGKYAAAQPLFEKALAINRRLLTDDHPYTAFSYNNLGSNLRAQGKYALAQPLLEKALGIHQRLLSDDHPETAANNGNLAMNLDAQGKYTQAQPLFEKALGINHRVLTDDHPATANSYNNLAYNLNAQGKYAQAQALYEKALPILRRLLTDNHAYTSATYNNLALNLNAQGKYAQAQPLHEKSLEIDRNLLGDDHPDTAISYNNLALNLGDQGKFAEAQPLYEKALAIFRRRLTDDHPYTAMSYDNLARNLWAQGKHAQAQALFEKALAIRQRLLTDDHPLTAASYNNLAVNLYSQGKHAEAQSLFEKALAVNHHLFGDDHPSTAISYGWLASNLDGQGRYAAAQPLHEKALEIDRRLLSNDHPDTASRYSNLGYNLNAQGKYLEARDRWLSAVKSREVARRSIAFTGLERAGIEKPTRLYLAAALARLGQPAEALQSLEEDLGRGLLDELAAREERRLAPAEQTRLLELTTELARLDRLAEATPSSLDNAERAKRFEDLKRQRALASIALGEFQTNLVQKYGALAGRVARQEEIQAALPNDGALVAWVDIPPAGTNAADPRGDHWGVVVRSQGNPAWVPIAGTGPNGRWTEDDTQLASRARNALRARPGAGPEDPEPVLDKLRPQRLGPLAKALGATTEGLPPARSLIVLPSRAMAGIPIEAFLAYGDTRTVSYAPSGTVFEYLRNKPRPDRHAGLLALGDPVYDNPSQSNDPKPTPDHGLLLNVVVRGSNAANHGLKDGDVLLVYNGHVLNKQDDLKVITEGDKPISIEVWRDGVFSRQELSAGNLGVLIDPRSAREAITEQRKLQQVLAAARSGGDGFSPLPGTRPEVEAIARLFKSDDRPTRALLASDASEPQLDRIAASGELGRFGFIHVATHGVIDEAFPTRSAVILTQTGLPDPLEQALNHKPVFDGRLLVREIQRTWDLKADLVTLSACETALGRESGGEGFVGFTQALLMSGARSVCLSLWKVDDKATSLLMIRFYQNLLGKRAGLSKPMPKAEALKEAKQWLRSLTVGQVDGELAALSRGEVRRLAKESGAASGNASSSPKSTGVRPYDHPYYWAAFVLVGDPN